jgi:hypothetical protein
MQAAQSAAELAEAQRALPQQQAHPLESAAAAGASLPGPVLATSQPPDEGALPPLLLPMRAASLQPSAALLGAGDALAPAGPVPAAAKPQPAPPADLPVTPLPVPPRLPPIRTSGRSGGRGGGGGSSQPLAPVVSGTPLELQELAAQAAALQHQQQQQQAQHGGSSGSMTAQPPIRTSGRSLRRLLLCCSGSADVEDEQMVGPPPAAGGPLCQDATECIACQHAGSLPSAAAACSRAGRRHDVGRHSRRSSSADPVLARADSLSPVGPDDINPLEHDVGVWDKQLAAATPSGSRPASGAATPLNRCSGARWSLRPRLPACLPACLPARLPAALHATRRGGEPLPSSNAHPDWRLAAAAAAAKPPTDAGSAYFDVGSRFSSFQSSQSEQAQLLHDLSLHLQQLPAASAGGRGTAAGGIRDQRPQLLQPAATPQGSSDCGDCPDDGLPPAAGSAMRQQQQQLQQLQQQQQQQPGSSPKVGGRRLQPTLHQLPVSLQRAIPPNSPPLRRRPASTAGSGAGAAGWCRGAAPSAAPPAAAWRRP